MVAGIGLKRKKYKENWEKFREIRDRAKAILKRAKDLIYEDTEAFEEVMKAYKLPKDDPGRKEAIQKALIRAAEVPLEVVRLAAEVKGLADDLEAIAPKSAISDVYVSRYQAEAALKGAAENVKINLQSMEEGEEKRRIEEELKTLL